MKSYPSNILIIKYPSYGSPLIGRTYNFPSDSGYRFSFNGKEKDNEVIGFGRWQDYGERAYRTDLGRFVSVDPLRNEYPHYSTYQYAGNKPTVFIDRDGLEEGWEIATRRREEALLSNKITEDEYVAQSKTAAMGGVIGAAVVFDIFVTKGRLSQFLIYTQVAGAFEHNIATTPEGRDAQDKRSKEALSNAIIAQGTFFVFGAAGKGLGAMVTDAKKLYNFGAKALGEMGEEALASQYGTYKPSGVGSGMSTSNGARLVDGLPVGTTVQETRIYYESKVGFQKYSGKVVDQVKKDAELIATGKVEEVTWVFYRSPSTGKVGASEDLLKALKEAGIKTQIAGNIPKKILNKAINKYKPTVKSGN
ncbi:MAG: hypothetical protein H6605_10820 [Flavobacteriales bacterium]|nr:hypothetical protein [Flavobacteriales bacterium]